MSLIPKANRIDVPDPTKITSVEFLKQVIDNIGAQMSSFDQEVASASRGDTAYVSFCLLLLIFESPSQFSLSSYLYRYVLYLIVCMK